MEKNTDDSQDERNRKRKIDDTADDVKKKREERLQKGRERSRRHREKKRNEHAALVIGGLTDADKEKQEERLRYDREKSKRYREKKKNEVVALSSSDFSSDNSISRIKKNRQKQNSKRYRDKIRTLNLLKANISNRKNYDTYSRPSELDDNHSKIISEECVSHFLIKRSAKEIVRVCNAMVIM
ncbi:jg13372 [Pararge aegeria aegeria]|uniref:Jg13372 protein n=1 Tax=Pararge aegeria aegeria TaxID=348720 RepID=A0A8S4S5U0_9NEOP|nr:jg13372 [Pararge aegeria aegeria]